MNESTKDLDRQLTAAKMDQFPNFRRHHLHASSVGEIHSRPFPEFPTNRVLFHYAFMSEAGASVANAVLAQLCRVRGEAVPTTEMRYHQIPWNHGQLRWESHSEFTTFTFDARAPAKFLGEVSNHPFANGFSPPGSLLSATRVEVRPLNATTMKLLNQFDQESLTVTLLEDGKSLLATDFRQDNNGMTVFLLLENKIGSARIGSYTKTAIELDTYRVLTMLGLPLARTLSQKLSQMEVELSRLTSEMKTASTDRNEALLDKINVIAAELESDAAASLFRFGASSLLGDVERQLEHRLTGSYSAQHRHPMS